MSLRMPLADIQFIADFAAFARSKGDEEYDGGAKGVCALAQFGYPGLQLVDCEAHAVPPLAYKAAVWNEPYAFPALADRLEALLIDAPAVHAEQTQSC